MKSNGMTALPISIKLMRIATRVLLVVSVCFAFWCIGRSVLNSSRFAIGYIKVMGDVSHIEPATVRSNIAGRIRGSFYTLDLYHLRTLFEEIPWVRKVEIWRVFPNGLDVQLEEHLPVALWRSSGGDLQLVNSHGEIFDANLGELSNKHLPVFSGAIDQASKILNMYQVIDPLLVAYGFVVSEVKLDALGSWTVSLTNGAVIIFGVNEDSNIQARFQQFLLTVEKVVSNYDRQLSDLEYVDLRYGNGYALKLRGIQVKQRAVKAR